MLAALTKAAEWAIEKEEADKLATAIGNVTRHYDIPGMSQQTVDWLMLIQTAGAPAPQASAQVNGAPKTPTFVTVDTPDGPARVPIS